MFFDGVFLSIYSHLLKKLELSKLCRKKLWDSKNPENGLFKKSQSMKKIPIFGYASIPINLTFSA